MALHAVYPCRSVQVRLATRIGQPIVLPPCFFQGMREPGWPEVCRVGNLRPGAETAADAHAAPQTAAMW